MVIDKEIFRGIRIALILLATIALTGCMFIDLGRDVKQLDAAISVSGNVVDVRSTSLSRSSEVVANACDQHTLGLDKLLCACQSLCF